MKKNVNVLCETNVTNKQTKKQLKKKDITNKKSKVCVRK